MTAMIEEGWTNCDGSGTAALRRAFGAFATGVTVVATWTPDGDTRAFTANSFSSVSLDPALVSVCLAKNSASLSFFESCETFSISILEASQRGVSAAFATREPAAKIAAVKDLAADDAPFVPRSLATFICSRHATVEAGDHVILIGQVQKYRAREGQPLGFFRGGYVSLGPDLIEMERLRASIVVGAILGHDGKVLLLRRPNSERWELPATQPGRGQRADRALHDLFAGLGIQMTMSVPYSLFQERDESDVTMVFSVESRHDIETGMLADGTEIALFGAEDAPWDLLAGEMKIGLVKRYLREMAAGLYSVYFDTPEGGSMVQLSGGPRAWSKSDEAMPPREVSPRPLLKSLGS